MPQTKINSIYIRLNHKNLGRKHKGILLLEKMPMISRVQRKKAKTRKWDYNKKFLYSEQYERLVCRML